MPAVALVSRSASATSDELALVASAVNEQVVRHLAPAWKIEGTVAYIPSEKAAAGYPLKAYVVDDAGNRSGVHVHEQSGLVFAVIQYQPNLRWSVAASHEIVEMLVDPTLTRTFPGTTPTNPSSNVEFVAEICDPVQAWPYQVSPLHQALVSDFCLPSYYRITPPAPGFSFLGKVAYPGDVAPGGYVSWITAQLEVFQLQRFSGPRQLIGPVPYASIFGDTAHVTNLRGRLDRFAELSGNRQAIGVHYSKRKNWLRYKQPQRPRKNTSYRKFQAYVDKLINSG